jgi:hypothetical protein
MKHKKSDLLLCILFCGFLFGMLALYLVLPTGDFSEKEKRYLEETPSLTWQTLTSGEFGEDVESWMADHIPGRDFLVGFQAYLDLFTGKQATKDIYLAQGDRLVEAPQAMNESAITRNMNAINKFAAAIGQPVELMLVPSAGWCARDILRGVTNPYLDAAILDAAYAQAAQGVTPLDLTAALTPEDFYRTDHHWTSAGAYEAYRVYMEHLGRDFVAEDGFTVTSHSGFYGSTYSRSGLWLTPGEEIELWDSGKSFTVTNRDSEGSHDSLFYPQRLQELDKYTVYLDGNHSLVRIQNNEPDAAGKLLVIRDSYANCLGTFLANSYAEVVLVDLRYYKEPISQLVEAEGFDNVLVCYSLGNFMTDANIIFLR